MVFSDRMCDLFSHAFPHIHGRIPREECFIGLSYQKYEVMAIMYSRILYHRHGSCVGF